MMKSKSTLENLDDAALTEYIRELNATIKTLREDIRLIKFMHFGLEISTKNLKRIAEIEKIPKSLKHKQKKYYNTKTGELKTKDVWYIPKHKYSRDGHVVGSYKTTTSQLTKELSDKKIQLIQNKSKLDSAKDAKAMNNIDQVKARIKEMEMKYGFTKAT